MNHYSGNPCFGIWARKGSGAVYDDSWGHHDEREMYWSVAGDYDPDKDLVRLHPYFETIKDQRLVHRNVILKQVFVRERFEFLGEGFKS